MSKQFTSVHAAAIEINNALSSDSGFRLDLSKLEQALREDLVDHGQVLPTEDEVTFLVMGDDDGSIPWEISDRFPKVTALIAAEF